MKTLAFHTKQQITNLVALMVLILIPSPVFAGEPAQIIDDSLQQVNWRANYQKASFDGRIRIAEGIGEEGAKDWAKAKGYNPILDSTTKTYLHGPDQVYRAADGTTHVVEAKGGTSPINRGYGHVQGTPEWAVESAKRIVKSNRSTPIEKKAALKILSAAVEGKLEVHVVRTPHIYGVSAKPILEKTSKCTDEATRLAKGALDDLPKLNTVKQKGKGQVVAFNSRIVPNAYPRELPVLGSKATKSDTTSAALRSKQGSSVTVTERGANLRQIKSSSYRNIELNPVKKIAEESAKKLTQVGKAAVKFLPAIGVGVDVGFRTVKGRNIEDAFSSGAITEEVRETLHAKNVSGMAGGWTGAYAGAEMGAIAGSSLGALFGGVGAPIGGVVGGVVGGVGGYVCGDKVAGEATELTMEVLHKSGTTVREVGSFAVNKAKEISADFLKMSRSLM